jgi:hypothetical protein
VQQLPRDCRSAQCFDVYRRRLWRGSYCSLDGVASVRGSQTDHLVRHPCQRRSPGLWATGALRTEGGVRSVGYAKLTDCAFLRAASNLYERICRPQFRTMEHGNAPVQPSGEAVQVLGAYQWLDAHSIHSHALTAKRFMKSAKSKLA